MLLHRLSLFCELSDFFHSSSTSLTAAVAAPWIIASFNGHIQAEFFYPWCGRWEAPVLAQRCGRQTSSGGNAIDDWRFHGYEIRTFLARWFHTPNAVISDEIYIAATGFDWIWNYEMESAHLLFQSQWPPWPFRSNFYAAKQKKRKKQVGCRG